VLAKHYELVIKPHPPELPKNEVYLYWHDRYHRDPGNEWLRDFVAQQFSGS
jgi:DNA-binding transcriptional LysR family regulator